MVKNTHTFSKGEKFKGDLENERYHITSVSDNSITYEYLVNGNVISVNKEPKENARMFIQTGYWKEI